MHLIDRRAIAPAIGSSGQGGQNLNLSMTGRRVDATRPSVIPKSQCLVLCSFSLPVLDEAEPRLYLLAGETR